MTSNEWNLSEKATSDLMNLLLSRGYFHEGAEPLEEITGDTLEDMNACQSTSATIFNVTDEACQIVPIKGGRYVTKSKFAALFETEMSTWGRTTIDDAAEAMGVDKVCVMQAIMKVPNIMQVGDELISSKHLDEMVQGEIKDRLDLRGHVLVSELASEVFRLPMDITIDILEDRIAGGLLVKAKLMTISGARSLITEGYEESEQRRVRDTFLALTLPTSVDAVCSEFRWDTAFILPVLRDLVSKNELPGELHESGGSSILSGAMYTPKIYLEQQRKSIVDYFSVNGYISATECQRLGISRSAMGEYVRGLFPSSTVLNNVVINADVIVTPLEAILHEAVSTSSFVDLSLHLPEEVMADPSDLQTIMDDIALTRISEMNDISKDRTGITVILDGGGLFVSSGMIRHITKTLLPPLIEIYAKARAEEIDNETKPAEGLVEEAETSRKQTVREKRKSKKSGKRGGSSHSVDAIQYGTIPLATVAQAVASEYPDIADLQKGRSQIISAGEDSALSWEVADEGESTRGPIYEVCRQTLYTEDFRASCNRSVEAELQRLKEAKMAISVRNRKDGAAKSRTVEGAFEDPACFATACYALQAEAKFIQFVSTCEVDDAVLSNLKEDFLGGCGAEFVGRITQFCLFKNEVDDGIFVVTTEGEPEEESDLPRYCRPVNCAVRQYPSTHLSCSDGNGGKAIRSPLPMLRESLSGGVGVTLARAWTCCGGRCYDGGVKPTDDGGEHVRPGNMESLLELVEESCLSICGLPFKKLDKKSEKQFLFARRQELTKALEATKEPQAVLELTIMLLFQQVKSFVVSGKHLMGPILDLLTKERKVTEEVALLLRKMADAIQSGAEVDEGLVRAVKACGLSRDISKHTIEGEQ